MSEQTDGQAAEQQALLGSISMQSTPNLHPEAQWFPEAGLGLFIHWGIASVHGNLDLSWSMMAHTTWDASAGGRNKITPTDYWKLAERFKPDAYDPDKWIAAAAKAGFKYAVLTTMHHDGYTLWPSEVGNFGVQRFLPGVDLVGPFIEACRKHGLKVGLYYSPPEWYFDREWMSFSYKSFNLDPTNPSNVSDEPCFDQDHLPVERRTPPPGHAEEKRRRFHARVEELLTRYGKIDLLWFDGGAYDNEIRDRARELQPGIVLNTRSCDGDFDHSECELPEGKTEGWFETCHCWQDSDILYPNGNKVDVWGYLDSEQYKSADWMLETYRELQSKGANFLLNVSPRPNGELPDVVYQRFQESTDLFAQM
jgi:alpha-L-fucosidase